MQLKKEISVGQFVSICISLGAVFTMLITDHVRIGDHEKRLTTLEVSQTKLNDTMIELATTVKDHQSQTINIK